MAITNSANVVVTNPRVDGELDALNQGRVMIYPEGASQSFKAGEFVLLSSGKVITATPGSNPETGPADVYGLAMQDATGTTDSPLRVFVLKPGSELVMSLADVTGADAGTGFLEPTVAHVGTTVSVLKLTACGKWVANVNAAGTNKSFQIIGLVGFRSAEKIDSTKSAFGAQVICRVITTALQNETDKTE